MDYRPQSPDLSGDFGSGFRPESPDLTALGSPQFGHFGNFTNNPHRFSTSAFAGGPYQPTSVTSVPQAAFPDQQYYDPQPTMPPRQVKAEDDDDFMPDAAPSKRSRRVKQEAANSIDSAYATGAHTVKSEDGDPTLGCSLNTSFPVARIKRIMQADEDIGKVAQVTPTVVSRALELFMIKLISAAAHQSRGTTQGSAAPSKGPRRVLAQHLKKAVLAEPDKFDFLNEIVDKVPDAPTKAKKEAASDSDEPKPKKRGKKRKDSGDDM